MHGASPTAGASVASGRSLAADEHAIGVRRAEQRAHAIDADALLPLADTTGTTSRSNTSRRHYGCPLNRAPRADDGRLVPAGLLAHGSCASPPPSRRLPGSGIGATLAAYSCGGSRGFEDADLAPRSLFTRRSPNRSHGRTVTRRIEAKRKLGCQHRHGIVGDLRFDRCLQSHTSGVSEPVRGPPRRSRRYLERNMTSEVYRPS